MKRFLKIAGIAFLVVLVLVIIVLIAGFVFLKNLDVKKYKPRIIQAASEALGRPVDFNVIDLKVSLDKGVRLYLSDFSIAEHPDFGSGTFATVAEIEAGVDILPFLKSRRVSIPNVVVHSPQIEIIRNAEGRLNVETLGETSSDPSDQGEADASSAAALPAVFIDAIRIDNAQIRLTDRSVQPEVTLAVTQASLDVRNFSLTQPFDFSLEGAILSTDKNLRLDGRAQLNLADKAATMSDTELTLELAGLPLDELRTLPWLEGIPLPQVLEGEVKVRVDQMAVSDEGLGDFTGHASLTNGKVLATEIVPGISLAAHAIQLDVKDFSLEEPFDIAGALGYESEQPNVSFQGKAELDLEHHTIRLSPVSIKTDLAQIPLTQIKQKVLPLKDAPLPEVLAGQLDIAIQDLSVGPDGLGAFVMDVLVKEGAVSMKDVGPGVSFSVTQLNADIQDFGLDRPFAFDVQLAYLGDQSNITTKGTATLGMADQSLTLSDTTASVDLSTLSMDELKSSVVPLKDVPLPEMLRGELKLTMTEATMGPEGLAALSGQGSLTNWEVKLEPLAVPVAGTQTHFTMTEKRFTTDDFAVSLGSGQITLKADVTDYMTARAFAVSAGINGLQLAEILDQKDAAVKVEGLVQGTVKAQGEAADMKSVSGEGNLEITEAVLKDINVLKMVLDKISFLPDVAARVEAGLPEKYRAKLKDQNTEIRRVSTSFVLAGGAITLEPITVEAEEFVFAGICKAGFDQTYVLDGSVKIPAELSAAMGGAIEELQYLFDANNTITLPVYVTGKGAQAPKVEVTKTAVDMGRNILRNEGGKQLEKLFNKALGVEEAPPSSEMQDPNEGQSPPVQKQPSPESQLIDGILNSIFE